MDESISTTTLATDGKRVDLAPLEAVVRELAAAVVNEGNVQAIFGAPVKLEDQTVIPVAAVEIAFGGGGGFGGQNGVLGSVQGAVEAVRKVLPGGWGVGGGGGFSVRVRPVGFIHRSPQGAAFAPIALEPAARRG